MSHPTDSFQPGIDRCDEILKLERSVVAVAVDEERWGAVDAAAHAAEEVFFDPRREFPRFRGGFRIRVHFAQGEISKHKPQSLSKMLPHLFDDRVSMPAVRALVIAVFDQDDGGLFVPLNVITGGDGRLQRGHDRSFTISTSLPAPEGSRRRPGLWRRANSNSRQSSPCRRSRTGRARNNRLRLDRPRTSSPLHLWVQSR